MTTSIEAVYEGGVFRPTRQITLSERTHVEVIVPLPTPVRDPQAVAAKLARIAPGAPCSACPESTSVDHDQILYADRDHL